MQKSPRSLLLLGVATTGISGLALLGSANSAQATILQQFTDLSSFQAGTHGLTTIDFSGLAPTGGNSLYASGLNISGVSFTGDTTLYVADSTPALYDWGSGAVLLGSNGLPNGTITATLPSGITAIGSDIMSFGVYASPFTITLAGGGTFTVNSDTYANRQFTGFTSDVDIASISFQATDGYTLLDNFTFGSAGPAASVPEPFSIVGTLIGGTAAMRMKKKLKSAQKNSID
jgi:hypothetical protein